MHGHHLRKADQMSSLSPWWTPWRSEYAWPDKTRKDRVKFSA
ncbi:hypothetical protein OAG06_04585 [Verrucomicrobia bacterium]|nr:hypothetical protein [Verrucomicrobiota bacterium]